VAEPDTGASTGDDLAGPDPETESNGARGPGPGPAKAVAVKTAREAGILPRLVASGQGAVAEQILQIAWANDIKVREDADLVEILSATDIDSEIPIEAIAAVAEILSYVYRANAGEIPIEEEGDDAPKPG
jgi:flagellar biosynthesis protein